MKGLVMVRMFQFTAVFVALIFMVGGCGIFNQSSSEQKELKKYRALGYVLVTPHGPKDGGDFGPKTPGTKTSGLQEAFDYSKKHRRDLYIAGGTTYKIRQTLHIPWHHSFRCDGGEYSIVYTGKHGDAVWIDSQMNVFIKLGSVYAKSSDGAAVHMKPETIGPDGFAVITASRFEFNYLIAGGDPWGKAGATQKGVSLLLDGEPGCITNNRIFAIETSGSDKGLYLRKDVFNNLIEIDFMHLCNTHIQIGDEEFPAPGWNRIETVVVDGDTLSAPTGARIFGHNNILALNIVKACEGRGIVFEPTARDNIVQTMHLAGGITNNAIIANNRVISTHSVGLNVATPDVPPSGQDITNRTCYSVQIIILEPGEVTSWTLSELNNIPELVHNPLRENSQPMTEETRKVIQPSTVTNSPRAYHKRLRDQSDVMETSQTVNAPLYGGQCIVLDPGDKMRFVYTTPPAWRWKALR